MSIRVKMDEDLPRQVADLFSERGHDAVTVVMQGWQGFTDAALWPLVQQEERWLITADKSFAAPNPWPSSGVSCCRVRRTRYASDDYWRRVS